MSNLHVTIDINLKLLFPPFLLQSDKSQIHFNSYEIKVANIHCYACKAKVWSDFVWSKRTYSEAPSVHHWTRQWIVYTKWNLRNISLVYDNLNTISDAKFPSNVREGSGHKPQDIPTTPQVWKTVNNHNRRPGGILQTDPATLYRMCRNIPRRLKLNRRIREESSSEFE